MLTRKQLDLFEFIDSYMQKHKVAPSYTEMQTALGYKSKSRISRLMGNLVERGFVRRIPFRARAIEIIRKAS